jgi:hypothetical protein
MALQTTVKVAIADEPVALRLLSALVLGWDALPLEIQIRLLRDASLMDHGFPNTTMLPKRSSPSSNVTKRVRVHSRQ